MRQFFIFIGSILRWGFYALVVAVVCAYGALLVFSWHAEKRETRIAEDDAPPKGRYLFAGDVNIYLQESGPADGLEVVLVPGFGGWSGAWQPTAAALAQAGYRVIAIDLPPFGFSQRPQSALYSKQDQAARIIGVLDALGIDRAILVGHSSGGGAAVETTLITPKRVRGLVLINAELDIAFNRKGRQYPSFMVDRFLATPSLRDGVVAAFITNPLFTRRLLHQLMDNPAKATDEWVARYQQPMRIKGTTAAVSAWLPEWIAAQNEARSEQPEAYRSIKIPIQLIWGDQDQIAQLGQARQLASLLPGTLLKVIYGTGHLPQVEENKLFDEFLLKALNVIKYDMDKNADKQKPEPVAAPAESATPDNATAAVKQP